MIQCIHLDRQSAGIPQPEQLFGKRDLDAADSLAAEIHLECSGILRIRHKRQIELTGSELLRNIGSRKQFRVDCLIQIDRTPFAVIDPVIQRADFRAHLALVCRRNRHIQIVLIPLFSGHPIEIIRLAQRSEFRIRRRLEVRHDLHCLRCLRNRSIRIFFPPKVIGAAVSGIVLNRNCNSASAADVIRGKCHLILPFRGIDIVRFLRRKVGVLDLHAANIGRF